MHVCVLRPVISIRRPERMGENFPLDTGPETQRSALSDGSASSSLGGGASPHNISTPTGSDLTFRKDVNVLLISFLGKRIGGCEGWNFVQNVSLVFGKHHT